MNTATVKKLELHKGKCGSHKYILIKVYASNKMKHIYKCIKCNARIYSVE